MVEIEWRTIQFFIDEGDFKVYEVCVDSANPKKKRCDCDKFARAARCKHVKFVTDKLENSNGVFNLAIPSKVADEEAMDALYDPEIFRQLVLKYGKIEVI